MFKTLAIATIAVCANAVSLGSNPNDWAFYGIPNSCTDTCGLVNCESKEKLDTTACADCKKCYNTHLFEVAALRKTAMEAANTWVTKSKK